MKTPLGPRNHVTQKLYGSLHEFYTETSNNRMAERTDVSVVPNKTKRLKIAFVSLQCAMIAQRHQIYGLALLKASATSSKNDDVFSVYLIHQEDVIKVGGLRAWDYAWVTGLL